MYVVYAETQVIIIVMVYIITITDTSHNYLATG